jgi:hypothetical protein
MDLSEIKTQEELEEFIRIRNLGYAARFGMADLNAIIIKLFETFRPQIIGIDSAD